MISVNEALQIIDTNMPAPRHEKVRLNYAFNSHLAEDILAPEACPRYTSSAMDGFALRWADCATASATQPAWLTIAGESQAGIPYPGTLAPGQAIRISTGAVVPAGADTVVRVEDTREEGHRVAILVPPQSGQDVRQAGEEFAAGTLLFARGAVLKSRELALLATVGVSEVTIYSQPRTALLVTGTELARHDDPAILPHQIRDSNSIMLSSAIQECDARLTAYRWVEDSLAATIAAISEVASAGVDIILCSGGVSVGRHDHVKDAAKAAGFRELLWKINQKPGKPLFVCKKEQTLLFGLPGNPVSAFMCFSKYVRPVLFRLVGAAASQHVLVALVGETFMNKGKRTNFLRVRISGKANEVPVAHGLNHQGSHMLSSIVQADGYVVLEAGQTIAPGTPLEVNLF